MDQSATTDKTPDPDQSSSSTTTKLPATASDLPLMLSVGLAMLFGAAGLWWMRRRDA